MIAAIFVLLTTFISGTWDLQPDRGESVYNTYVQYVKEAGDDNRLINTALFFLGKPYKDKTLEGNDREELVVNLREFDCLTFVETCIALRNTTIADTPSYDVFKKELQKIRYRDGVIDGYLSRLHYTADWIFDNGNKGLVYDKTKEAGGEELPLNVYFMSAHPGHYPHLRDNPENIKHIKEIESSINQRCNTYYVLPKAKIADHLDDIHTGDIICFVTSAPGLDISHLGIAYWTQGVLTFVHASSKLNKVVVNPDPLEDYCLNSRNNKGIMLLRVK